MRNSLLFCFLFLCFSFVYSQTTYTKKYNSFLERYDYFDSSNKLIGYQKYNTFTNAYEYTDLTTQNSNESGRYIVHDYGTPKSNFNVDLAMQALAQKQQQYQQQRSNNNQYFQQIMDKNKELQIELNNYSDLDKRELALDMYNERAYVLFENAVGKSINVNAFINRLINIYNETIEYVNNQISKSVPSTTMSKSNDESNYNSSLANTYFNNGLNAEKTEDFNLARTYYRMALDLEPSYTKATDNLCHIILKDESQILREIKSLKASGENNQRLKELLAEKEKIYRGALLYFEKALIYTPNNEDFQSMATLIKKRLNE